MPLLVTVTIFERHKARWLSNSHGQWTSAAKITSMKLLPHQDASFWCLPQKLLLAKLSLTKLVVLLRTGTTTVMSSHAEAPWRELQVPQCTALYWLAALEQQGGTWCCPEEITFLSIVHPPLFLLCFPLCSTFVIPNLCLHSPSFTQLFLYLLFNLYFPLSKKRKKLNSPP